MTDQERLIEWMKFISNGGRYPECEKEIKSWSDEEAERIWRKIESACADGVELAVQEGFDIFPLCLHQIKKDVPYYSVDCFNCVCKSHCTAWNPRTTDIIDIEGYYDLADEKLKELRKA